MQENQARYGSIRSYQFLKRYSLRIHTKYDIAFHIFGSSTDDQKPTVLTQKTRTHISISKDYESREWEREREREDLNEKNKTEMNEPVFCVEARSDRQRQRQDQLLLLFLLRCCCAYICIYEGKRCQEPRNTEKTEKKKQKKNEIAI